MLEEGLDEAAGKLLDCYEEDVSATWLYSRALWVFRREGESVEAKRRLREAIKYNRYVPLYLLGRKWLPRLLPQYIGIGDENEAVAYVVESMEVWRKTPGALEWLDKNT